MPEKKPENPDGQVLADNNGGNMLNKNVYKIACDRGSCKNIATYSIQAKGFGRGSKFYLCEECIHVLYDELRKNFTPKSPKNAIARGMKKEEIISG